MDWLGNLYVWLRDELPWVFKSVCLRCWHEKSQHVADGNVAKCAGENYNHQPCACVYTVKPRL